MKHVISMAAAILAEGAYNLACKRCPASLPLNDIIKNCRQTQSTLATTNSKSNGIATRLEETLDFHSIVLLANDSFGHFG